MGCDFNGYGSTNRIDVMSDCTAAPLYQDARSTGRPRLNPRQPGAQILTTSQKKFPFSHTVHTDSDALMNERAGGLSAYEP
ncbi:uncharacterized protein MYCFIDRAFT_173500 [Pseudocercospora fijiensis CIRAD86]|uniref:Uncharacterized protein n=1 Tax=Pseudocercospora fijiensis (strain CIRAD86) TaxID=383855 RepID=M3AIV6_PSEFD|nr:uncharacterized protein MYCFIDRAFT_173500 [Pseudocercospora fijiensis CIRAD86]EME84526.1 hypothetical protein MYCFIDRAFT_173500 [Pseudocercospora fijiensis CIRAD86]